jgi:putative tryptophan/tyrosine transport system substrate-binding protein
MSGMKRREFIALLGSGAGAAWPLAARGQQSTKLPTIGFLGTSTSLAMNRWVTAFVQRLRELGWIEGRTVAIEYRWAEGRYEHLTEIANEFVRLKVDVIVTYATPPVVAAKQATAVIPIVSAVMGDPVGTGLVASLARPGGNVTGLSVLTPDLAGKRLELLREVVPGLRRLAFLGNIGNPITALEMSEVRTAIVPVFGTLKSDAQALYVAGDPLVLANRVRINTLALVARLPAFYNERTYVEAGGLMSYGVNWPDLFRRTAELVDRILRGTKPGDIPVEQPTKFDLVVNLTTAKALGLTVSEKLLVAADEVIE